MRATQNVVPLSVNVIKSDQETTGNERKTIKIIDFLIIFLVFKSTFLSLYVFWVSKTLINAFVIHLIHSY